MIKKTIVCATAFAFLAGFTVASPVMASDPGPADITMVSTIDVPTKPKPAIFPHKVHQDVEGSLCADCHHSADADGKKVDYVDGQEVAKCETCHNKAAAFDPLLKISSLKNAAHNNCKGCHKEKGMETKCASCHPVAAK